MEDELLNALRAGDSEQIDRIAGQWFISQNGQPNKVKISHFERYAPCSVKTYSSFVNRKLAFSFGTIKYNNRVYMFN